jgi:hypothetical protein
LAENKQAAQAADAALAPVLAEIARQQAEEKARAATAQATAGAGAEGLAKVLGGIAPATEQTYQNAAGSQAAIAKGFSDAFTAASNGSASNLNEFLAKQGSPQQIQGAGQAGGDVLFGLGGYIPASTMLREGAGFTAAAQQLPASALGRGQMEQQGIRAGSLEALKKLDSLRLETKGKRGGLYQEALAQLKENEARQREADRDYELKLKAYGLNEAATASLIGDRAFDQQLGVERLKNDRARIKLQAIQSDRNFNLSLDRLGIQEEGLRLRAAELEARRRAKPGKNGKGGFTAKQRRELKADAGSIARNAFKGIPDPDAPGEWTAPQIGYQEAIRIALDEGIPLVIAQIALNRYYKPGQRGRPRLSFQERRRAEKQAAAAANAKRGKG